MKPLAQYEREKLAAGFPAFTPMGIGVACPVCGAELMTDGRIVELLPRKKVVKCQCGFAKRVLA